MIHFVTLFLTLTLGSHPVEIAVTDDRVTSVVLLDGLNRAVRDLRRSLKKQFIVWIEGDHMPQELRLTDEARSDLRFAGQGAE